MADYIGADRMECVRQRVIIQDVNISNKQAAAREAQGGKAVTIDLSVTNGHTIVWPRIAEEWYCTKIADRWILDKKCAFGNEGFQVEAQPGDHVTSTDGTYYVDAPNITLSDSASNDALGDLRLADQAAATRLTTALYGSSTRTAAPRCEIRNAADYNFATTDIWAATSWSTVFEDNANFYTQGTTQAAPSYLTIPLAGRYRCQFHASVTTTTAGALAARIVTGVPSTQQNTIAIATQTPFGTNNGEISLDATREIYLAAGTKLYWSSYANVGSGTATMKVVIYGMPSMINLRWIGPA